MSSPKAAAVPLTGELLSIEIPRLYCGLLIQKSWAWNPGVSNFIHSLGAGRWFCTLRGLRGRGVLAMKEFIA